MRVVFQVEERRSCRIQATRQGREDTRLALFASVVIEGLRLIRKQFVPDNWSIDRVSAKESAITSAVVPDTGRRHQKPEI